MKQLHCCLAQLFSLAFQLRKDVFPSQGEILRKVTGWSQTLAQKETAYLKAAKLAGSGTWKIIFKHILPNIMGPILVTSMLDIGTMMMELAALSFLGLGAKPPAAEWGSMMSDTRSLMDTAPWVTFSPGIAIFISVMIFNLLGDTIRDYADPKSRRR